MFGDDFYLELQDHGMLEQKKVLQERLRWPAQTGIPLVATNDVHYLQPADAAMQDVLILHRHRQNRRRRRPDENDDATRCT